MPAILQCFATFPNFAMPLCPLISEWVSHLFRWHTLKQHRRLPGGNFVPIWQGLKRSATLNIKAETTLSVNPNPSIS